MTTSKLSPGEMTAYERWELPTVTDTEQQTKTESVAETERATAQELEAIQEQAYAEGFALGQKEGAAAKQQALQEKIDQLQALIQMLETPLNDLDDDIVAQLAALAMTVARQVVRRELKTDEGEIVAVVREAISALPASSQKIVLHLHPDDVERVKQAFAMVSDNDEGLRWKIVDDPLLSRGGCIINSENSRIDATVEARLNRVIATLLGGEREDDE